MILIFDIDLKDQDHLIDLDLLAMILIFNGRILIFLTMILIFFGMILIFDLDHFQSDLLQPCRHPLFRGSRADGRESRRPAGAVNQIKKLKLLLEGPKYTSSYFTTTLTR